MEKSANINIRINADLKREAEILFESLGLNLSTAINMFLMQSVIKREIPFRISKGMPNRKTMKALKESEKMMKHPEKYKSYTLEEFKELLDNLED